MVEHGGFLAIDSQGLGGKVTRRLPKQVKLAHQSAEKKSRQQELIGQYIKVLSDKLVEKKSLPQSSADQLVALLKDMTRADPNNRITSSDAFDRMAAIQQQLARQSTEAADKKE